MRTKSPQIDRFEAPVRGVGDEGLSAGPLGGSALGRSERALEVLTIDGPAGAGKSSVARDVAKELGFEFLNTGLFYRAVTWRVLQDGLEEQVSRWTEGLEVEVHDDVVVVVRDSHEERIPHEELRQATAVSLLSRVAEDPVVREFLLPAQRRFAASRALVVEGRDTGSIVFPDARWKVFLTASLEERANRRLAQDKKALEDGGDASTLRSFDEIRCEIACRDSIDFCREVAPLRRPEDATYLDTSDLSQDEVTAKLTALVRGAEGAGGAVR